MFAAMCRSQGLLVKYVTGHVKNPDPKAKDNIYHAYNIVKIDCDANLSGLPVKKDTPTIIDPTFAMGSKGSKSFISYMSDSGNYKHKHYY